MEDKKYSIFDFDKNEWVTKITDDWTKYPCFADPKKVVKEEVKEVDNPNIPEPKVSKYFLAQASTDLMRVLHIKELSTDEVNEFFDRAGCLNQGKGSFFNDNIKAYMFNIEHPEFMNRGYGKGSIKEQFLTMLRDYKLNLLV